MLIANGVAYPFSQSCRDALFEVRNRFRMIFVAAILTDGSGQQIVAARDPFKSETVRLRNRLRSDITTPRN